MLAGAPSPSPSGRVVWMNQFPCGAGLSHRGVSRRSVRAASLGSRSLQKSRILLGFGLFFFLFVLDKQLKLCCRLQNRAKSNAETLIIRENIVTVSFMWFRSVKHIF